MPTRPPTYRSPFQPARVSDHLIRGSSAQRGYDAVWRRFRLAYLKEHPLCVYRQRKDLPHRCEVSASVVDHIQPLNSGGERLDPSNCRSVCRACHAALTQNYVAHGVNEMPKRPVLASGGWI